MWLSTTTTTNILVGLCGYLQQQQTNILFDLCGYLQQQQQQQQTF